MSDIILSTLESHLRAGRWYHITTDNPETVRRARAFAERMGALVVELDAPGTPFIPADSGPYHLRFIPKERIAEYQQRSTTP
jgi:hypothetical protein